MNEQNLPDEVKKRLSEVANGYQPKLSPKQALLIPLKTQIKELRARQAAYDDIRLILSKEKIIVSLNTLYRFCRDVIGEKSARPFKTRAPKHSSPKIAPVEPSPESIQATLQERRERFPGPWSRRKRGPRIADSKNL
jgi:hypothetical protein